MSRHAVQSLSLWQGSLDSLCRGRRPHLEACRKLQQSKTTGQTLRRSRPWGRREFQELSQRMPQLGVLSSACLHAPFRQFPRPGGETRRLAEFIRRANAFLDPRDFLINAFWMHIVSNCHLHCLPSVSSPMATLLNLCISRAGY